MSEKSIITLAVIREKVSLAAKLLKEAERDWSQPLYFDEEDNQVNVAGVMQVTIQFLDEEMRQAGAWEKKAVELAKK